MLSHLWCQAIYQASLRFCLLGRTYIQSCPAVSAHTCRVQLVGSWVPSSGWQPSVTYCHRPDLHHNLYNTGYNSYDYLGKPSVQQLRRDWLAPTSLVFRWYRLARYLGLCAASGTRQQLLQTLHRIYMYSSDPGCITPVLSRLCTLFVNNVD